MSNVDLKNLSDGALRMAESMAIAALAARGAYEAVSQIGDQLRRASWAMNKRRDTELRKRMEQHYERWCK